MIALALLLAAAGQDSPSVMYGRWSVECPQSSLDSEGRVECSALAALEDVTISARRQGDKVQLSLTSPKCAGLVGTTALPLAAFDKRRRPSPLTLTGVDMVLAAALGFAIKSCGLPVTEIDGDRLNMNRAFDDVVSRRKLKK